MHSEQHRSVWFRLASYVVQNHVKVLLVVLLIMSPLSYLSTKLQVTVDQNQLHDRTQPEYETWLRFRAALPAGMTWPYALIAQPGDNATLLDAAEIVELNNALIAELVDVLGIHARLFSGPTWLNGKPQRLAVALGYLGYPKPVPPYIDTPLFYYSQLRNGRVPHLNIESKAFYTEIDTPFDPQGSKVEPFIRTTRAVIAKHNRPGLVTFHLALGLTSMVDVSDTVYSRAPAVLFATVAVLLCITAVAFRSAVVAIRLSFTILLTLSWSFGSGVLVFQLGLFDWVGPSMANVHAISWLAPTMTFSLITALGCDYEVFLTTRIREFRAMGFTDNAAIVCGYYRAGGVITTAGLIMVVAFGSLVLSSQMLLVECGFLLAWSVVLDTFVVRSLVSPALMVLCGEANWWPSQMPPGTREVDDMN